MIEITALIFGKKDDQGGDDFLLDKVLDKTGMKGTGKSILPCSRAWPTEEAWQLPAPVAISGYTWLSQRTASQNFAPLPSNKMALAINRKCFLLLAQR